MFNIFKNRNKGLSSLIKMSDYLGHSLRENVELFDINDSEQKVIYITESKKIISANYADSKSGITLTNIVVQDSDVFEDSELFDSVVENKVSSFVHSLFESDYKQAELNFDDVISMWGNQVKYSSMCERIQNKVSKFNKTHKIIEENSIQQVIELMPQIVEYLKENKDNILNIPEIVNGIKLSNVVSEAFGLPQITYEQLENMEEFDLPEDINESIYEIICNQELIKQELLESKRSFDTIWATNDNIKALAQKIHSDDEDEIVEALADTFNDVPYIALATKKQLSTSISNVLDLYEHSYTKNDLTSYISKLFELKKPIKEELKAMINEKYGINAQNLNEVPSFKSLINTQTVIFESLSRVCPKKSAIKNVLHEAATTLKSKTGIESIDVNSLLMVIFEESDLLNDLELDNPFTYVELNEEVLGEENIAAIVNIIKKNKLNEAETPETKDAKPAPVSGDEESEEGENDNHPVVQGDENAEMMGLPDVLTKEDFIKNRADLEEILTQLIDGLESDADDEVSVDESTLQEQEDIEQDEEDEEPVKPKKKKKKPSEEEDEDGEPDEQMYTEEEEVDER